ncbi:ATP-grasp domain-containing protein [Paenibacillus pedocola]|uniref:ATP-grasp domain-containing protein n=1 Tax=Paenibacillus pedocola TaxID=3242193 RepID=UPI002877FA45|nr:ATP-grasp domain-containing protein [Paenibacillus typhae]
MRVIFCRDPLDAKRVDMDYEAEWHGAQAAGFKTELLSLEDLLEGEAVRSIRQIAPALYRESAVYRGWMMKPEHYEKLYYALLSKNIELINDPSAYAHCHYLPYSYSLIASMTPRTVWRTSPGGPEGWTELFAQIAIFGQSPLIVKDYVKSRKHEWTDACYIPDASDHENVRRVVSNFVERQGDGLSEGIVLREFVPLEYLQTHDKSGMPLSKEYRIFFLDQQIIAFLNYWDDAAYDEEQPELTPFRDIARTITSRFFTMDIAKTSEGRWIIVELGDGGVSGLPVQMDVSAFYEKLMDATSG